MMRSRGWRKPYILICPTASSGTESARSLVVYGILKLVNFFYFSITFHFGGTFSLYLGEKR